MPAARQDQPRLEMGEEPGFYQVEGTQVRIVGFRPVSVRRCGVPATLRRVP